jgi:glycosyltransferase involved in cell wall biosynthesis
MVGPGYGHNIEPWLIHFQKSQEHELFFLTEEFKFDREAFSAIEVLELKPVQRLPQTLARLRQSTFDVLYIHGAYWPLLTLFILKWTKYRRAVVNIWGQTIIERSQHGSYRDRKSYKSVFEATDLIFCNWLGTKNQLERYYPNLSGKTILRPWGLHEDWFREDLPPEPTDFTKTFLADIDENATVCFWPKSPTRQTRFDVVIAALDSIRSTDSDLLDGFVLFIWLGNVEDKEYRSELEGMIKDLRLEDRVIFVDHPYVPFTDIAHIWKRADFGVNIVDLDQLSTTILEPMLMGKEVLLSDIEPYRVLNTAYDLGLSLVSNTVDEVASRLRRIITNDKPLDQTLIEHRKQVISTEFRFSRNLDETLALLSEQIKP